MIEAEIREQLREKQRQAGREAHRGKPKGKVSNKIVKDLSAGRNAQQEAAAATGVSQGYVSDAERIREADPQAFEDVKAGRKLISRQTDQDFVDIRTLDICGSGR